MSKITFSKMESISGLWNDDQSSEVMVDGVVVAELTKHVIDVGGSMHVYRVGSYGVFFLDHEAKDREFNVPKDGDARAALKEAKAYVRRVLSGK